MPTENYKPLNHNTMYTQKILSEKIDLTKSDKKSLLKSIKSDKSLSSLFVESEYFEDFYSEIFEVYDFTEEQLQEVKYYFIKKRI
jgi:hypothetical protein